MKIALIGATGNVGTRILNEALSRGHTVTAIARNVAAIPAAKGVAPVSADIADPERLAAVLKGHDAVVSSLRFRTTDPADLFKAVRRSGVTRYLVVGGAGSLEIAPGKLLIDAPDFPAPYRDEALAGKAFLDALRPVTDLQWTMLSPSALFTAGERTGRFRLGKDTLLVGADGKSWISYEDFSIALLDEIEVPRHPRSRFTVGY